MNEYDVLCRVIHDKFRVKDKAKKVMTENKDEKELGLQAVRIEDGLPYELYRFDPDRKPDFLPFFCPPDTMKGLRAFCDYIIVADIKGCPTVVLIEMKRGKNTQDAPKQLRATEVFVKYLMESAERVAKDFQGDHFDRKKVKLWKVIIKHARDKKEKIRYQPLKPNEINTLWDNNPLSLIRFH